MILILYCIYLKCLRFFLKSDNAIRHNHWHKHTYNNVIHITISLRFKYWKQRPCQKITQIFKSHTSYIMLLLVMGSSQYKVQNEKSFWFRYDFLLFIRNFFGLLICQDKKWRQWIYIDRSNRTLVGYFDTCHRCSELCTWCIPCLFWREKNLCQICNLLFPFYVSLVV